MVGRGVVDQRAHERRRVGERLVDDDPVEHAGNGVDQRLMLAVLNDQPAGGGAALTGAEEGGLHRDRRRRLDILRLPDH